MMNAFATAISIGLQYGVPLDTFVRKFSYMRFDPEGMTTNPEIPFAKSLPDYIMRWLASRFLDPAVHEELGIMSSDVRAKKMAEEAAPPAGNGDSGHSNGHANGEAKEAEVMPPTAALTDSPPVVPAKIEGLDLGPACSQCGGMMQRTGSCYTCSSCGNNTGCG
jgi:ribonucleoside-diphosphate reductase alpha chain